MSPLRLSQRQKILAVIGSVALTAAGAAIVIHYGSQPPSADEFFARNPHLSRPAARVVEVPIERTSDAFLPGDFQLLSGRAYPVRVDQGLLMKANGKTLVDSGFSGSIRLHSLGVEKRLLTVIAEFNFDQLKSDQKLSAERREWLGMGASAKGDFKNHSLLIRLDPAGKIREMYSASDKLDEVTLETKLTALNLLFKRLPPLQVGSLTRTEGDDAGVAFPVTYAISAPESGVLRILGQTDLDEKLGATPQKTAAAGMAGFENLAALATVRTHKSDWLWDQGKGLPRTQIYQSSTDLKNGGEVLSSYAGTGKTQWQESQVATYGASDVAKFKIPVDFRGLLNRQGSRLSSKMNSGAKSHRSWMDLRLALAKGADHLQDDERDAIFLDLAKAVRSDPSLIGQVKGMAFDAAAGSREVSMALGALGFEASPEAQAAMIEIFNRPGATDDERTKVMTEFALASAPLTDETKGFLKEQYRAEDPMVSDVASGAGLALGASIAHDGDPNSVQFLQKQWSKAHGILGLKEDVSREEYLLATMGNSKSDAFADQVTTAAKSDTPSIRAAAVNAVRFAQDTGGREILFRALTEDTDTDVRAAAAGSLLYQPYDTKTASGLQNCAANGSTPVKVECYRVLGMRIEQPGVRPYLQARLDGESDPQLKAIISSSLSIREDDASTETKK